jgi:drug/metabolite transporter (DMT)-like permease
VGLSTALAGAATGSLFGVLYSNIWTLGSRLDWWRFLAVTGGAIAVFVVWLIGGHGLWERQAAPL